MGLLDTTLKHLDRERELVVNRKPECEIADQLATRFPDIFLSASADYYVSVSFNVNAVRDMVPVLRWLAEKGYRQGARKPAVADTITWRLGPAGDAKLTLQAFFKEDGSCRRVKVREEARMVPVYEIQCGGKVVNDIADQLAEVEGE